MIFKRRLLFLSSDQAEVNAFQNSLKAAGLPVDVSISTKARNYSVYVRAQDYEKALEISGRAPYVPDTLTDRLGRRVRILAVLALGLLALLHICINLLFQTGYDATFYYSWPALKNSLLLWLPLALVCVLFFTIWWNWTKRQISSVRVILTVCSFVLFAQSGVLLLSFLTQSLFVVLPLILMTFFPAKALAQRLTQPDDGKK